MTIFRNLLILDLDGVLITTPSWKPDEIDFDNYSKFNSFCVENLNIILQNYDFEIWISSSRRINNSIDEMNEIFFNRNINKKINGFLPILEFKTPRNIEIESFLKSQEYNSILILDDDTSLQNFPNKLKIRWIQTVPLMGLNETKLNECLNLLNKI